MIINGFGICYMLNVCGCGYLLYFKYLCVWPVIINGIGICYMLNVCVCVASDH